ncbi:MAG: D-glycerate dehydrogenase [Bryobacterales bacterium]|nr:D-glycerate dehydrogenase [Bryobacterales bacterium]
MPGFRVIADGPLDDIVLGFAGPSIEFLPWDVALNGTSEPVDGIYTYGHPHLDGAMLDGIAGVRVISNYGVGVDHINVPDAVSRGIPVGNTPNILDGATADAGFALLLAAARRIVEGDRYARSPEFLHYDPGFMLGREVHSTTLGIVGLGNIGRQVARRALAFDMRVLYRNRSRNLAAEAELGVEYATLDDLLRRSDFVILSCPLTDETEHLIDAAALRKMKRTATLVNIARGPVVHTQALFEALRDGVIASAGLDVTDPEPLPRDHPLLDLPNVTVLPHLGSATIETHRRMAEISITNLRLGLDGKPLLHQIGI